MPRKTIQVPNISCGHCTATIERELGQVDGVTHVVAEAVEKRVSVTYQDPASWEQLNALLIEIGFAPEDS